MAAKTSRALAIGDHVRLKSRDINQHQSYRAGSSEVAFVREPVDGLVFTLREIKTGQLVPSTKKALDGYVIEIVYSRTFNPRYASLRNVPRGADDPTTTASWRKLRAMLRKQAEEGHYYSAASSELLNASPLGGLLDGWKIVKVWSKDLENLEKDETPEAAAE